MAQLKLVVKNDDELYKVFSNLFDEFQENKLFNVVLPKDELKEIYTKHAYKTPIFRKSPLWDCSLCRHTIATLATVFYVDDSFQPVFFLEEFINKYDIEQNYKFMHDMFNELVNYIKKRLFEKDNDKYKNQVIRFYNLEKQIGIEQNMDKDKNIFSHFFVNVKDEYRSEIVINDKIQAGIATLKYYPYIDIINNVLYYIDEGYIYRGQEKIRIVEELKNFLSQYNEKYDRRLFILKNINTTAIYFNNDVISSLVDDLIDGVDEEKAIENYNKRVAPENYRQTKTTIVYKIQIMQTEKALKEMGYDNIVNGFEFAKYSDLSILDVLWTNRKIANDGTLLSMLEDNIKPQTIKEDNIKEITFSEFIDLLKNANSIEVDKNSFAKMVLIKDKFDKPFWNWSNHISFCYETGLADVDNVTKIVKEKGGNINAKVRFSLYWENLDDLDLHLRGTHEHIYYGNKSSQDTIFELDIDMNVDNPIRGAVENIYTNDNRKLTQGDLENEFEVYVHNYTKRETPDKCILNVYIDNKIVYSFEFKNPLYDELINLCKFRFVKNGNIQFTWINEQYLKEIKNEQKFVEVDTVLLSPNYWSNGKGNKHIFFLRKGENIQLSNVRPFNIEFINEKLLPHRKVLNLLSRKIVINGKPELVGYGISFSKERNIFVKVNGCPYKIKINPKDDIRITKEIVNELKEKIA